MVLSLIIGLAGDYTYIRDTLTGRSKPNRVSWFMWSIAPLIGVGAALSAHSDPWVTSRIFLAGFLPLIVFIASFVNKKSYWKLTTFDFICGACSAAALIAWLLADSPSIAVLLAAIGDGFAALPTIRKAWKNPETETGTLFIASLIGTFLVLPSIPKWDIVNSAFQIYLLLVNTTLIIAIYRKHWFKGLA